MQYYDQHLHTYFSFDSEEKFENYLNWKSISKYIVSGNKNHITFRKLIKILSRI